MFVPASLIQFTDWSGQTRDFSGREGAALVLLMGHRDSGYVPPGDGLWFASTIADLRAHGFAINAAAEPGESVTWPPRYRYRLDLNAGAFRPIDAQTYGLLSRAGRPRQRTRYDV